MNRFAYFSANLILSAVAVCTFVYGSNLVYDNCMKTGYAKNQAPPFVCSAEPDKLELRIFDFSLEADPKTIRKAFSLAGENLRKCTYSVSQ